MAAAIAFPSWQSPIWMVMNSGSEDVVFPFYSFYSFLFSVTGLGSSRISETKVGLGARVPCSGPAEPEVLGARRSILLLHLPPFSPPSVTAKLAAGSVPARWWLRPRPTRRPPRHSKHSTCGAVRSQCTGSIRCASGEKSGERRVKLRLHRKWNLLNNPGSWPISSGG